MTPHKQKVIDKIVSTHKEFLQIQKEEIVNGKTIELIVQKATVVGKMETLSWIVDVLNEDE